MSLGGLYLEGPIHGGAYFRNFTVCQNISFYFSWCQRLLVLMNFHPPFHKVHTCMRVSLLSGRPLSDWYFSSTWVDAWNRVKMSFDVMFNPQWFCFARKHKSVHNGNWTEGSAIWSEIIRVISKLNERAARVRFEITSMISDQNCRTRSSITTITSILKSQNLVSTNILLIK